MPKRPISRRVIASPRGGQRTFSRPSNFPGAQQIPLDQPRQNPVIPLDQDSIRIIPLGGVEEIGKNMTAVQYRDDIIIIDAGLQFPGEEAPGVDYVIPDTSYLQKRKDKIRGLFVTHGHLDHTGGIPYICSRLGNPTIYTRYLTSVMIKKRQEEFPELPPLKMEIIEENKKVRVGKYLSVRAFRVTHTIPDSMGLIIETPYGNIIFTGDIKVDHNEGEPLPAEVEVFSSLGKENNLFLAADSTNVERPGWSFSERVVHENLRKIIIESKGRLIMGTFASLLERIMFVIKVAEEQGKKIVVRGRSMKTNIAIAKQIELLKVKPGTIISHEHIDNYPPEKIIVLA
ncbi:MAG: ribonuclease J, partial [Candidatus Paceibacterota bacterium]